MRFAICDDDKNLIEKLKECIKQEYDNIWYGENLEFDTYNSGEALIDACVNQKMEYNLIFLDVYMGGISGFDTAEKLAIAGCDIRIAFITSNSDLVYDSFDYQPFYFIRKDNYNMVVKKVLVKLKKVMKQDKVITVINRGQTLFIPLKNIYYIESDRHSVLLHTTHYDYTTRRSISDMENELKDDYFIKIHRKYLVNLKYIKRIDTILDEVTLSNDVRLEMSRHVKENVKEAQKLYLRSMKNI